MKVICSNVRLSQHPEQGKPRVEIGTQARAMAVAATPPEQGDKNQVKEDGADGRNLTRCTRVQSESGTVSRSNCLAWRICRSLHLSGAQRLGI
jgi:hypothetical protein